MIRDPSRLITDEPIRSLTMSQRLPAPKDQHGQSHRLWHPEVLRQRIPAAHPRDDRRRSPTRDGIYGDPCVASRTPALHLRLPLDKPLWSTNDPQVRRPTTICGTHRSRASIAVAAMAISHYAETQTDWRIKKFAPTTRRYPQSRPQGGRQTLTTPQMRSQKSAADLSTKIQPTRLSNAWSAFAARPIFALVLATRGCCCGRYPPRGGRAMTVGRNP